MMRMWRVVMVGCLISVGGWSATMTTLGAQNAPAAPAAAAAGRGNQNALNQAPWEMPLWEEYFEQLRSDVADMRNIGGRGGGMITAALFLSKFVGDCPWIHLDIASTDWSERERAYLPKGPTGIGTRLLIQFLIDRTLP